jgi:hypothetical protein
MKTFLEHVKETYDYLSKHSRDCDCCWCRWQRKRQGEDTERSEESPPIPSHRQGRSTPVLALLLPGR